MTPSLSIFTVALILALLAAGLLWRRLQVNRELVESLEVSLEEAREQCSDTERMLAEREALLVREQGYGQEQRQLLVERDRRLSALAEELADYRERCARLEVEKQKDTTHFEERLASLGSAREELTHEFERLAGRIFDERQRQFTQHSRENVSALMAPVREQIEQFRTRLETLHGEQQQSRTQLTTQLEYLAALNRQMSKDATNLTRALKGDNKSQGNWGELILERVLERSGLRQGIEYEREVVVAHDSGRLRPDAVIYLPEQRHLIIDAKVSLNAWSEVVAATDETTREQAMRRHLRSVRTHIETLSGKAYARLPGMNTPDMVFLFMPVEPAFAAVFEQDDCIFHEAFDQHIVLVTPTTLLASLRTVAGLWRLERQNDNAREIVARAEKLLDKCHGFVASMEETGVQLERAASSHRQAMNRLRDGQGSLMAQAGRLNALGARNRKPWPESVREAAQEGYRVQEEALSTQRHSPAPEDKAPPGHDDNVFVPLRFDDD